MIEEIEKMVNKLTGDIWRSSKEKLNDLQRLKKLVDESVDVVETDMELEAKRGVE